MPSPKTKSKPTLSMSRPKIDPAAAEAFVLGESLPEPPKSPAEPPSVTVAPKLVEVVAAPEVEEPTLVEAPTSTEPEAEVEAPPPKPKSKARREPRQEKAPARGIVTRSSGRQVRRRVLYLPPNIDKKLKMAAAMRDEDVSEVVASLLLKHL